MSVVDDFLRKLMNDLKERAAESAVEFLEEHYDDIKKAVDDVINPKLEGALCEIHRTDDEIVITIEYNAFDGYCVSSSSVKNNVVTVVLRRCKDGKEKEGE